MTNKEKISAVFFGKRLWSLFDETDREWLMASAHEGDLQAASLLIHGMHHKYHCWVERFVDEDTHEEVDVERYDLIEGTTFEPDEELEVRLRQMLLDGKDSMSEEEWDRACVHIGAYQDAVGVDEEEDCPIEADYILRGSSADLEAVKTLVNELTNRYGTPGNELGLYVPMEILMQILVGSKYYRGNLLSMDTDSPDCIVLRAEANSPEPLLYALRQAFPHLEVEIKDEA